MTAHTRIYRSGFEAGIVFFENMGSSERLRRNTVINNVS
jgi:hypothetical protein